jgi:hypothetical protein
LRASREAIVLFPAPAGPSMAMMSLRSSLAVIRVEQILQELRRLPFDAISDAGRFLRAGDLASLVDRGPWAAP